MAYPIKQIDKFKYSFILTLFNTYVSTVDMNSEESAEIPKSSFVLDHVVRDRQMYDSDKGNTIVKKTINNRNDYKTPFIMYITDVTNYERGQPKLELILDLSSAATNEYAKGQTLPLTDFDRMSRTNKAYNPNSIPLSFRTKTSLNNEHRKIEMPLPPIDYFEISFNLNRMRMP